MLLLVWCVIIDMEVDNSILTRLIYYISVDQSKNNLFLNGL